MTYERIAFSVEQNVATIALNRPDKRNAMSDDMRSEFIHALENVTSASDIRALVTTGSGGSFCASQ